MKQFLLYLIKNILWTISFYFLFLVLIATSSIFTGIGEKIFRVNGWEQGATFRRTKDLALWSDSSNKPDSKVLFIGASSCYRSINPEIIDQEASVNSFNAGSAGMPVSIAYYLIKSIYKQGKYSKLVLEINPLVWSRERDRTVQDWMLNCHKANNPVITNLAVERPSIVTFYYLSYRLVKDLIPYTKSHRSKFSRQVEYRSKGMECIIEDSYELNFQNREDIYWSKDNLDKLKKTVEFCKENDIKLTILMSPVKDFTYSLKEISQFDKYIIDMNQFEWNEDIFIDEVHLNCEGSTIYSKKLAQLIK